MTAEELPTPPDTPRPKLQKTIQVFAYAAQVNSEFAQKITDSPKVTASAAILAFSRLDPATQLDMIREAREKQIAAS
jgi:hypothetical protein